MTNHVLVQYKLNPCMFNAYLVRASIIVKTLKYEMTVNRLTKDILGQNLNKFWELT